MLEVYITKIQNVEKTKVNQMVNYLLSDYHINHKNSKIINYVDKQKFLTTNFRKIKLNKENRKRGKELKNSNKSLTFNIPVSYSPNVENVEKIQNELIEFVIRLYKKNGVEISREDLFYNIHFEKYKNRHINLITPTLDNFGKNLRWVNDENIFYKTLSSEFTKIVDNVLNKDINNYITQKTITQQDKKQKEMKEIINKNNKIIKKQKENYEKEILTLKEEKNTLQEQKEEIERVLYDLEEKEFTEYSLEDLDTMKKNTTNKFIKRVYTYIIRIKKKELEHIEDSKSIKRVNDTITKIMEDNKVTKEETLELYKVLRSNPKIIKNTNSTIKDKINTMR